VRIVLGPDLAAAAAEAAAVATVWRTTPPTVPASAASLADALADGDLVHVVAHGRHHRQQPLFSSLRVADGPCSLYDLETTGVGAEVVVLASCDAASATIRSGDEPVGLATGLLALGARSVVAPVSPVPDALLPPVMERLHRGLAAGLPTDEALVDAAGVDRTAAAAFVVTGVPG
jgi:CHAT domain-containing protein